MFENLAIILPINTSLYNTHGGVILHIWWEIQKNPKPKLISTNTNQPAPSSSQQKSHRLPGSLVVIFITEPRTPLPFQLSIVSPAPEAPPFPHNPPNQHPTHARPSSSSPLTASHLQTTAAPSSSSPEPPPTRPSISVNQPPQTHSFLLQNQTSSPLHRASPLLVFPQPFHYR